MITSRDIEPCRFVFVVGTPGAGKSLFCNEMEVVLAGNGLQCSKHGDYPFLQSLYRSDQGAGRQDRFKRGSDGAEFEVTDPSVYDLVLKKIYDDVLSPIGDARTIKIVEFARPRYDTAFLYYTLRALSRSVIIHISTAIDVCIQRNEARGRELERRERNLRRKFRGEINPAEFFDEDTDLHYVPRKVMRDVYSPGSDGGELDGDQKLILSLLPARGYFCVENSEDDKQVFRATARSTVEQGLLPLIIRGESYANYYKRRWDDIGILLRLFNQRMQSDLEESNLP